MAITQRFQPAYGQGATMALTTASSALNIGLGSKTVKLTNTGANACYVRFGFTGQTATAADCLILAGSQIELSKDQDHNQIAALSAAATTNLHIIPGEGF
jgi:hypothetical protein